MTKQKPLPPSVSVAISALVSPYVPMSPNRVAELFRDASAAARAPLGKPGECITIRELARRRACSEKTIRRAIAAGQLKTIRVGPRSVRIPVSELAGGEA